MVKLIVFLPLILFFGFFGLLIVGFFILIFKLLAKAKSDSWEGTVIEKIHNVKDKEDKDNKGFPRKKEHILSLKVKLDNGEIHAIPASPDFFNQIKVGDRLRKEKGSLWPKKIS